MISDIQPGLVSVIIPCYNQGHFLREAIQSVLSQTYTEYEIIVVDDGSTEHLDDLNLACKLPHTSCIRQENKGLAGARNAGFPRSKGEFILFLDSDDRVLPRALEIGFTHLRKRPEAAAVYGQYQLITRDGSFLGHGQPLFKGENVYERLLRSNFIATPASVLYRRWAFDKIGLFDTALSPAADYDMYLRISREFQLCAHDEVVAEYRQHGTNMSCNSALMLDSVLKVLEKQKSFINNDPTLHEALQSGVTCWHSYYGGLMADSVHSHVLEENWKPALRDLLSLMTLCPNQVASGRIYETLAVLNSISRPVDEKKGGESLRVEKLFYSAPNGSREAPWINAGAIYEFRLYGGSQASRLLASVPVTRNISGCEPFEFSLSAGQLGKDLFISATPNPVPAGEGVGVTRIEWNAGDDKTAEVRLCVIPLSPGPAQNGAPPPPGEVRFGSFGRIRPISRDFGFDRGQPIDRYYIESFLEASSADIRGRVLEIGDNSYTCRFGGSQVSQSDVLNFYPNIPGTTFVGNLTDAPQIPSETFDCIICTQTLNLIFDSRSAVQTLYRILKPGGVLLATVPGISQISDPNWGDCWFWSFTSASLVRLLQVHFDHFEVRTHGNVLSATSFLQGLASSELDGELLDFMDPNYQLVITARARKVG